LPLVLALLPLSRAEVEGFVFSDVRFLAEVVPAGAGARAVLLAQTGLMSS
jgi:hypothetical protein